MAGFLKGKEAMRLLLLGSGVIILTPIIKGLGIPDIAALGNVITVGAAVAAGAAAFGTQYLIDRFM